ncbi:unnamed protein product [Clavelina lepadiformis]|uniref:Microsomal glutathione S-transferase 1 n=1 Tax=Clavelina lepadiformis TaxID=159417 RepID=A0ABP0GFP2_CLALP
MLMSAITAFYRVTTKTFINEEDVSAFGSSTQAKGKPSTAHHPNIERVRRAHLNDIENVFAFVLIGILYLLTNPSVDTATLHFKVFAGARFGHTIAYLIPIPQPSRFLLCATGWVATASMAFTILSTVM